MQQKVGISVGTPVSDAYQQKYQHSISELVIRKIKASDKAQKFSDGGGLYLHVSPLSPPKRKLKAAGYS